MPAITPASNQYANALSTGMAALTPGSIMLLLRRRMGDMDGQIGHLMNEIETNTTRSEGIQKQVEALSLIKAAMVTQQPDATQPVALENITVQWEGEEVSAAYLINTLQIPVKTSDQMPIEASKSDLLGMVDHQLARAEGFESGTIGMDLSPSAREALQREAMTVASAARNLANESAAVHGIDTVTGSSIDATIQAAQTAARSANSGNEVLMVQMQSAMQQRSQSVTMATQMLKSINDSSNSIAQNIGR